MTQSFLLFPAWQYDNIPKSWILTSCSAPPPPSSKLVSARSLTLASCSLTALAKRNPFQNPLQRKSLAERNLFQNPQRSSSSTSFFLLLPSAFFEAGKSPHCPFPLAPSQSILRNYCWPSIKLPPFPRHPGQDCRHFCWFQDDTQCPCLQTAFDKH